MNKRFVYSGLAGGVFSFFFGWLMFGIILAGSMDSVNTEQMKSVMLPEEEMNFPAMILSNFAISFLIAYIFHVIGNIQDIGKGLMSGAIILLFTSAFVDLGYYAMTTLYDFNLMAFEIGSYVVWGACIGAMVAWVGSKVKD